MKRTREAPHSSRQLEGILQKRRLLDAKLLWYTTILRKVCVNAWPTRGRQLPLLHYSVIERKITFVGWGWDLPCSCLFLAIIIISLFVPWHCVCLSPFLPPLFGSAPAASSSSVLSSSFFRLVQQLGKSGVPTSTVQGQGELEDAWDDKL